MQMKCKNNFQNWFALRDFQSVMMHTRCCVNFQTKELVCVCRAKPKFVLIFIATLYCCYYHCLRSFVARLLCEKLPFWRHLISLPSSRAHARTRHKSINNTILCVPCNGIAKLKKNKAIQLVAAQEPRKKWVYFKILSLCDCFRCQLVDYAPWQTVATEAAAWYSTDKYSGLCIFHTDLDMVDILFLHPTICTDEAIAFLPFFCFISIFCVLINLYFS